MAILFIVLPVALRLFRLEMRRAKTRETWRFLVFVLLYVYVGLDLVPL